MPEPPAPPPPPFPLSRETTIRLDRDGVFWHDGDRIEHPGLTRAFASWIGVDPETGRYILKNAINWAYLTVDDAPLRVRGVAVDARGVALALSDGASERLDPATLRIDADDQLYCDARGGELPARFDRQAAVDLLGRARAGDAEAAELVLELPGGDVTVPRVARGEGARRRVTMRP
jgi:hypothetical protein